MPHQPLHCACVIFGDAYSWIYVERLYSMLCRNLDQPPVLHVFTEPDRPVPAPWQRHDLDIWPEANHPRRAWWYKMQMFDSRHALPDPILYLDLDVVITGSMQWVQDLTPDLFWTIRDFRYLWRPTWQGINSSFMRWYPSKWPEIWSEFIKRPIPERIRQFPGDQDFLSQILPRSRTGLLDPVRAQSYRWQIQDGGMDMHTRRSRRPGSGAEIQSSTSIIVCHGRPKPHDIADPVIKSLWR